ncbi:hypothetical protein B0A48_04717 [Cryoendolithus antarcticus]|uniref:Spindle pole body component n=1 Tax=Cryoendolithus antarcticus TaxID=1507870 RepID=A0A1V8TD56_9PEZI|nr:hypothetical protein B0A48_04717 [Cryoendolithus antarcticus]
MLHEVLLALSGHPSPLFGQHGDADNDLDILSPSEKSLLQSLGQLSHLHTKLRNHLDGIAASHRSIVGRAVATSIRQTHLARFQRKIIDVERRILTKDPSIVGAYNIVPLSTIVSDFGEWQRRMQLYWDIACFMRLDRECAAKDEQQECTGAALIDRLRVDTRTGYPDIEAVALELSKVAEAAWLRQLASWVLHGRLPTHGADDFFIRLEKSEDEPEKVVRNTVLLPSFVSKATASSMMFIGQSLRQLEHHVQQPGGRGTMTAETQALSREHSKHLARLDLPLDQVHLARAVSAIRQSLSQGVLQSLLPLSEINLLLSCMRRYFLVEDGDFALTLIAEAEKRVSAKQQGMGKLLQDHPAKALQSLSVKDSELGQCMAQTWKSLASRDDDEDDTVFAFARRRIVLAAPGSNNSRPSTSHSLSSNSAKVSAIEFGDLLFLTPTCLSLAIESPLNLIFSTRDMEIYSSINAYLIAIRRAHLRLSDLWRRTSARRDHPAPLNPRYSSTVSGRSQLAKTRSRHRERMAATRRTWATSSAAIFLLSETAAFLEGEIIRCSWDQFTSWVGQPPTSEQSDDSGIEADEEVSSSAAQRDPETIAAGHRAFLAALVYALLLTDVLYTKEVRALLGNIDQLVILFVRLLDLQHTLDQDDDAGLDTTHTAADERKAALDLDRARKKVDSDLKSVVNRLRQLDQERIGAARYSDLGSMETGGFEPWKGGGVDRLLMKLEFGRVRDEGYDLV